MSGSSKIKKGRKDKPCVCEYCNATFFIESWETRRFCKQECYHKFQKGKNNPGSFKKGNKSPNLGKKGIRLSPATEFKKGHKPSHVCQIGEIRIRSLYGKKRAFIKIAEPNIWRAYAVFNYQKHHGQFSKGYLVHHRNRNTLDDSIENLELMTRKQHLNEHRMEFLALRQHDNK